MWPEDHLDLRPVLDPLRLGVTILPAGGNDPVVPASVALDDAQPHQHTRDGLVAAKAHARFEVLAGEARGPRPSVPIEYYLPARTAEQVEQAALQALSTMDLIGVLSNHDLRGSLAQLAGKLAAVRASGAPLRVVPSQRRRTRRPGWVIDALVEIMGGRGEPMRAREVHAAVEGMLGEAVAWSSVKGALSSNVSGSSPRFVRVARGRYVLAGR